MLHSVNKSIYFPSLLFSDSCAVDAVDVLYMLEGRIACRHLESNLLIFLAVSPEFLIVDIQEFVILNM